MLQSSGSLTVMTRIQRVYPILWRSGLASINPLTIGQVGFVHNIDTSVREPSAGGTNSKRNSAILSISSTGSKGSGLVETVSGFVKSEPQAFRSWLKGPGISDKAFLL